MALSQADMEKLETMMQGIVDQFDSQLGKQLDQMVDSRVDKLLKPLLDAQNPDGETDQQPVDGLENVGVPYEVSVNGNGNGHNAAVIDPAHRTVSDAPQPGLASILDNPTVKQLIPLVSEIVAMFKPAMGASPALAVENLVKASAPIMDIFNSGGQFAANMYTYAARATGQVPDASQINWSNPLLAFGMGPDDKKALQPSQTGLPAAEVTKIAASFISVPKTGGA